LLCEEEEEEEEEEPNCPIEVLNPFRKPKRLRERNKVREEQDKETVVQKRIKIYLFQRFQS
jgi:hypothetical protein